MNKYRKLVKEKNITMGYHCLGCNMKQSNIGFYGTGMFYNTYCKMFKVFLFQGIREQEDKDFKCQECRDFFGEL